MSNASDATGSRQPPPPDGPLLGAARAAATLAQKLNRIVAVLAGASTMAGLLLWGIVWWPGDMHPVVLILEGGSLLVALAPGIILGLFYQGLSDLLALPNRLSRHSARTADQSLSAAQAVVTRSSGVRSRIWRIVKQIWALRSVLLENRALLVRYGALVRFINPGFLLLVAGATVVSLALIPATIVIVIVVLVI